MSLIEARNILIQLNLWRRDNNVPNSHEMPNPTEVGLAIDRAVEAIDQVLQDYYMTESELHAFTES